MKLLMNAFYKKKNEELHQFLYSFNVYYKTNCFSSVFNWLFVCVRKKIILEHVQGISEGEIMFLHTSKQTSFIQSI